MRAKAAEGCKWVKVMRLVFMGTPDFTLPILDALYDSGHELALIVTQPDAPVGRKQVMTPPPAKDWAIHHGLPVFQPDRLRDEAAYQRLAACQADVFVVAAFGQLLPPAILTLPRFGCINIHASLLPKYRGAAPIQWAILNGDPSTGVTIMQMAEGLDDGDILLQREIPIAPDDTGESLFDKLAHLGAEAITEALPLLEAGRLTAVPQEHSLATKVGKIDKQLGRLDFSQPAVVLERFIRGLYPWPGTYATFRGKTLKLLAADALTKDAEAEPLLAPGCSLSDVPPGGTALVTRQDWLIRTGDGLLAIRRVQPAGKKAMAVADFLRGYPVHTDDRFE